MTGDFFGFFLGLGLVAPPARIRDCFFLGLAAPVAGERGGFFLGLAAPVLAGERGGFFLGLLALARVVFLLGLLGLARVTRIPPLATLRPPLWLMTFLFLPPVAVFLFILLLVDGISDELVPN